MMVLLGSVYDGLGGVFVVVCTGLGRYSKQSVGVAILGIQVINRYSKHKQDLDKSKKISKTALAEH